MKQAGVLRSSVFGSVVREQSHQDSDVDFLVELPEGRNLFDLIDLEKKLENALKRKVDVVTYRSVHHLLKDNISKEQIKIL